MQNKFVNNSYDLQNEEHVKEIVDGCSANNRNIQKALFEMCYGKCMSVAMRYANSEDSAKDILSDAFIKVFKKINTFKVGGSLEGWVLKVVVNTALDSLRKNKKTLAMDTNDMAKLDDMSHSEELFEFKGMEEISGLTANELIKEIHKLPPGYRAVFNMFVFEDMSHDEITKELDITEEESKSSLSRAKILLKERVKVLIQQKNAN